MVHDWPLAAQFALSIGVVVVALAVRWALDSVLLDRMPWITVFIVLLPLVLLVRPLPFLVASILGCAATLFLFIAPQDTSLDAGPTASLQVGLFCLAVMAATATAWLSQRARDRISRADTMLRAFVDDAPACKWVTGADGRIIYVNKAMAGALGRPAAEILGRTHAEILPPKLAKVAIDHIRAVRESGHPCTSFEEIEPLGGHSARRMLEWRRFALRLDGDGRVLVAGMANDVTERDRLESALRASEARLRALFEAAVYGVITIDEHGLIQSANPAAERLFGYPSAELIGRGVSMLMPEPYRSDHDSYLQNYLRTGERRIIGIGREVVGRRKDGSEFPMDLAVSEFHIGGQRFFQGVVADITERRLLEEERARHATELEASLARRTEEVRTAERAAARGQRMAAVGTFAAGLAHDMRNLLLPLSGRLDAVMGNSGLTGEARTDLTVVVALLDHLREMANNLSLFARDPDQEGTEGTTKLPAWCSRVKGFIEASAAGAATRPWIRVMWDIDDDLPPVAIAPHRLTQAVLNLAHNARDAILALPGAGAPGAEGGGSGENCITIAARATPDAGSVEISVSDDGCGMDEETKRHCTEPFFTTKDRPAAAGSGGSGLGMALVHAIAERSGGHLRVESARGKGTTITLVLPAAPAEMPPGPIGRARVGIEDKRVRGVVVALLRSLRYDALDGDPEADSASTLWVTDGIRSRPEHAAAFLSLRQGQRVVALVGDDGWRAAGAVTCEPSAGVAKLRRVLAGERSDV